VKVNLVTRVKVEGTNLVSRITGVELGGMTLQELLYRVLVDGAATAQG
jgi:hypothetical protein